MVPPMTPNPDQQTTTTSLSAQSYVFIVTFKDPTFSPIIRMSGSRLASKPKLFHIELHVFFWPLESSLCVVDKDGLFSDFL